MEVYLSTWIKEKRLGAWIDGDTIKSKGLEIYRRVHPRILIENPESKLPYKLFKASRDWLENFVNRKYFFYVESSHDK